MTLYVHPDRSQWWSVDTAGSPAYCTPEMAALIDERARVGRVINAYLATGDGDLMFRRRAMKYIRERMARKP